jgi:hypothetical protein
MTRIGATLRQSAEPLVQLAIESGVAPRHFGAKERACNRSIRQRRKYACNPEIRRRPSDGSHPVPV